MNYVLDTNILLIYLRDNQLAKLIDQQYQILSYPNISIISVVSIGELKSLALQNNWGEPKMKRLNEFVKQFLIADIHVETIIQRYAEIDAFSQGRLLGRTSNFTAKNMGKNDLWIAATASVLNAELLTTDKDFIHLDNEFLKLRYFNIK